MADRATLHQLFAEAARRGLTEASPFADISLKRPSRDEVRRKHNPLSATQVRSLLDACVEMDQDTAGDESPSFHDIVFALVNTGMREAELLNLEWSDVIWDRGVICVQAKHVTETRLVALSPGQVRALRQFANGRAAGEPLFASAEHLARLGVRLPLRRTEDLMSLRVGDVDFSKGTLASVRNYEWKPKATEGEIPMSAKVTQLLHGLHAKATGNFVFGHGDGGSCRLRLLRLLKRAQKKAGIPGNLRVHDLRHTTAVLLRRRGVPLETIMGILRHADIRETLIYAPYSLAEGRQAIAKLDDIYDI
jgi:integrase